MLTSRAMQRSDFSYDLPAGLIAEHPVPRRSDSRLLCLDRCGSAVQDCVFSRFPELLEPGDLVVFNDTRVIPARMYGRRETGGKAEILVERITGPGRVLAHVRTSKTPAAGSRLWVDDTVEVIVEGRTDDLYRLYFPLYADVPALLEHHGHVPLPPYLRRADEHADHERYQTVYARVPGAVAAPTAGLHFDRDIMQQLAESGVHTAYVTLHVGAGTFQPVRVDNLADHVMHREYYSIDAQASERIAAAKARGSRIVAVGTTVVRSLEAAAQSDGIVHPVQGETRLFITPGFRFRVVDALLTNFHLPESTLLMLVCAFAGYRRTMDAYRHAVAEHYRFFSYGDAMFIDGCSDGVPGP